jgi:hypothetical protein
MLTDELDNLQFTDAEIREAMRAYAPPSKEQVQKSLYYWQPYLRCLFGRISKVDFWRLVSRLESQGHECFVPKQWIRPE